MNKKPKQFLSTPKTRINEEIRSQRVRTINAEGEMLGILAIEEALRLAQESELDLVEVAPDADPP
ncbi:MAG TPA: translation initiation factor IF-3, partial [bacterium]|nr:translation initiation factor IF-3 [bacterium]